MGWTHDTGYGPAYAHEGYPAAVLEDGTDTGVRTPAAQQRITGRRAACDCGWRGGRFWPRAEFPGSSSTAPDEVDGFESGGGVYAEWSAHLHATLPGLAVHDAAERLTAAREELDQAVVTARRAGASWAVIGVAAGLSRQSAHERWGGIASSHPSTPSPAAGPATTTPRRSE